MEKPIASVQIVSDGIIVRFSDGVLTYYPQQFLREHIGAGANQVFLDHDPFQAHDPFEVADHGAGRRLQ